MTQIPTSRRPLWLAGATALALPVFLAGCAQMPPHTTAPSATRDSVYQAAGNNPAWHLTLAQNTLTFNQTGTASMARKVLTTNADSGKRVYTAQDLQAEVTPKACTDTMSGQNFSETVHVTAQGQAFSGCGGDPTGPATLNNTKWRVIALDGHSLAAGQHAPAQNESGVDMAPTLDINATGKISGSDSCNRYVGGLEFKAGGKVVRSAQSGISTMMACLGKTGADAQQFNTLKQSVERWRMDGEILVLETTDNRTIKLRPVL